MFRLIFNLVLLQSLFFTESFSSLTADETCSKARNGYTVIKPGSKYLRSRNCGFSSRMLDYINDCYDARLEPAELKSLADLQSINGSEKTAKVLLPYKIKYRNGFLEVTTVNFISPPSFTYLNKGLLESRSLKRDKPYCIMIQKGKWKDVDCELEHVYDTLCPICQWKRENQCFQESLEEIANDKETNGLFQIAQVGKLRVHSAFKQANFYDALSKCKSEGMTLLDNSLPENVAETVTSRINFARKGAYNDALFWNGLGDKSPKCSTLYVSDSQNLETGPFLSCSLPNFYFCVEGFPNKKSQIIQPSSFQEETEGKINQNRKIGASNKFEKSERVSQDERSHKFSKYKNSKSQTTTKIFEGSQDNSETENKQFSKSKNDQVENENENFKASNWQKNSDFSSNHKTKESSSKAGFKSEFDSSKYQNSEEKIDLDKKTKTDFDFSKFSEFDESKIKPPTKSKISTASSTKDFSMSSNFGSQISQADSSIDDAIAKMSAQADAMEQMTMDDALSSNATFVTSSEQMTSSSDPEFAAAFKNFGSDFPSAFKTHNSDFGSFDASKFGRAFGKYKNRTGVKWISFGNGTFRNFTMETGKGTKQNFTSKSKGVTSKLQIKENGMLQNEKSDTISNGTLITMDANSTQLLGTNATKSKENLQKASKGRSTKSKEKFKNVTSKTVSNATTLMQNNASRNELTSQNEKLRNNSTSEDAALNSTTLLQTNATILETKNNTTAKSKGRSANAKQKPKAKTKAKPLPNKNSNMTKALIEMTQISSNFTKSETESIQNSSLLFTTTTAKPTIEINPKPKGKALTAKGRGINLSHQNVSKPVEIIISNTSILTSATKEYSQDKIVQSESTQKIKKPDDFSTAEIFHLRNHLRKYHPHDSYSYQFYNSGSKSENRKHFKYDYEDRDRSQHFGHDYYEYEHDHYKKRTRIHSPSTQRQMRRYYADFLFRNPDYF